MEIMSIANVAMRQLGTYAPFLQSGMMSESWFSPLIEWAIRLAIVGLFATAFKTGRSKHGPLESIRIGKLTKRKTGRITYLTALLPNTYVLGGGAYQWISLYIAQDPDVQRQLRDRVIRAEDEDEPPRPLYESEGFYGGQQAAKPLVGTWIRMGVTANVGPVAGMYCSRYYTAGK